MKLSAFTVEKWVAVPSWNPCVGAALLVVVLCEPDADGMSFSVSILKQEVTEVE